MTINELIKSAIKDKKLRSRLLNDPMRTCKYCGIIIYVGDLGNPDLPLFTDSTVMQGGYQP
ncbi:hypothetical protein C5S39_07395 [Candidatus Methanophagaceae archaeon]|nr:hypothetical protein C5S39_07375 [Methanophagales archaeon]KAF5430626.1 hypothetical protein C5S39_07395 [Methanophagales archaeon]